MSYKNVDKMCKIVHKLFGNISSFTYLYGIKGWEYFSTQTKKQRYGKFNKEC